MLYFLQETEPPYRIKMGYSKNPTKRISTLSAILPQEVQILKVISGERVDESFFHGRWKEYRVEGKREWYYPAPELLDEINVAHVKTPG